jgi:hypothetical protein
MFVADHAKAASRAGARLQAGRAHRDGQLDSGRLHRPGVQDARPAHAAAAGAKSPSLWGVAKHLRELFGESAATIRITPRHFNFRYRSAAHFLEVFRTWYGPIHKAFLALPPEKGEALAADLTALLNRMNIAGEGSLVVPSEYAEVVIVRR